MVEQLNTDYQQTQLILPILVVRKQVTSLYVDFTCFNHKTQFCIKGNPKRHRCQNEAEVKSESMMMTETDLTRMVDWITGWVLLEQQNVLTKLIRVIKLLLHQRSGWYSILWTATQNWSRWFCAQVGCGITREPRVPLLLGTSGSVEILRVVSLKHCFFFTKKSI